MRIPPYRHSSCKLDHQTHKPSQKTGCNRRQLHWKNYNQKIYVLHRLLPPARKLWTSLVFCNGFNCRGQFSDRHLQLLQARSVSTSTTRNCYIIHFTFFLRGMWRIRALVGVVTFLQTFVACNVFQRTFIFPLRITQVHGLRTRARVASGGWRLLFFPGWKVLFARGHVHSQGGRLSDTLCWLQVSGPGVVHLQCNVSVQTRLKHMQGNILWNRIATPIKSNIKSIDIFFNWSVTLLNILQFSKADSFPVGRLKISLHGST